MSYHWEIRGSLAMWPEFITTEVLSFRGGICWEGNKIVDGKTDFFGFSMVGRAEVGSSGFFGEPERPTRFSAISLLTHHSLYEYQHELNSFIDRQEVLLPNGRELLVFKKRYDQCRVLLYSLVIQKVIKIIKSVPVHRAELKERQTIVTNDEIFYFHHGISFGSKGVHYRVEAWNFRTKRIREIHFISDSVSSFFWDHQGFIVQNGGNTVIWRDPQTGEPCHLLPKKSLRAHLQSPEHHLWAFVDWKGYDTLFIYDWRKKRIVISREKVDADLLSWYHDEVLYGSMTRIRGWNFRTGKIRTLLTWSDHTCPYSLRENYLLRHQEEKEEVIELF